LSGKVPVLIGFFRDDNAASRARCNTQAAALALFGINSYFTSHLGDYAQLCFWFAKKDTSRPGCSCKAKRPLALVYNRDARGKKRVLFSDWPDFIIPAMVFEVQYPFTFYLHAILIEIT
jgi:hypothetical protein